MALDTAGLLTSITNLLNGVTPYPPGAAGAGTNWSDANGVYSLTGSANAVPAVEAPGQRSALATGLQSAFSTISSNPAQAGVTASNIVLALDAYWVAMLFAGQTIPPIPTAGSPILAASLTAIFGVVGGTHASKALQIRDAIDLYTKAVVVTFGPGLTFTVV